MEKTRLDQAETNLHNSDFKLIKYFLKFCFHFPQGSRRELIQMDFEDILKYFRVSMPKKYLEEEEYKKLINSALGFRVCDLFILQRLLSLYIHPVGMTSSPYNGY